MKPVNLNNEQRLFQKAMAMESAKAYCRANGLSWERLKEQRFDLMGLTAVFSQPSDVKPLGLTNDRETMPKPTLVIRYQDGTLVFEQTEHTTKYLAQ